MKLGLKQLQRGLKFTILKCIFYNREICVSIVEVAKSISGYASHIPPYTSCRHGRIQRANYVGRGAFMDSHHSRVHVAAST